MHHDVITLDEEVVEGGEPLLKTVMTDGKLTEPLPDIQEIRRLFKNEFALIEDRYTAIYQPDMYPVEISEKLLALRDRVGRQAR